MNKFYAIVGLIVLLSVLFLFTNIFERKAINSANVLDSISQNEIQNEQEQNFNLSKDQELSNNQNTNMKTATIKTNLGDITIEFYENDAPKTVENFIKLAESDFYDNVIFHRVIKGFMIQGGDPTGTGSGGPGYRFDDELNPETESFKNGYKRGVVAMANAGPNTNGSQFFIMHSDYPLPNLYTIFGKVISGLEVVDKIAETRTGPNDRPVEDIVILDVVI
jgi:cyclophilin family peptidyl-prolyl cis-trans isomerase